MINLFQGLVNENITNEPQGKERLKEVEVEKALAIKTLAYSGAVCVGMNGCESKVWYVGMTKSLLVYSASTSM